MQLNEKQGQAVEMAQWLKDEPGRVGILAGPAGTGKTTSLRAICEQIGDVVILSPTNRAALRATQLSGRPASTIHAYLYKPYEEDGQVRFRRRNDLYRPSSGVIIVDESSMLGFDVAKDLWPVMAEIGISFLFIGDPFQLPPVTKDDEPEFSVFNDVFEEFVALNDCSFKRVDLDVVMRQALESPILYAATEIRKQPLNWPRILTILMGGKEKDRKTGEYARDAEGKVISWPGFPKPHDIPVRLNAMLEDDINHACITHTNNVRHQINREVRKLRGWTDEDDPQPGEPLLVRRNCKEAKVSNGEIIKFTGFINMGLVGVPKQFRFTKINEQVCLVSRDGIINDVQPQYNETRGFKWPFVMANFGYAMTCHASQGSEFDWVILQWNKSITEMKPPLIRTRWIYTAMTRAKHKFIIGGIP